MKTHLKSPLTGKTTLVKSTDSISSIEQHIHIIQTSNTNFRRSSQSLWNIVPETKKRKQNRHKRARTHAHTHKQRDRKRGHLAFFFVSITASVLRSARELQRSVKAKIISGLVGVNQGIHLRYGHLSRRYLHSGAVYLGLSALMPMHYTSPSGS